MQCWGWNHTPGLAHTLLRVAHSEWDTENGSSGKLAALRVSALPLQVTKLVFHEDGKMNLIKFPFDKQISMPIGNKVDNSRMKTEINKYSQLWFFKHCLLSINVPENGSKERTLQQSQSKSCNAPQTLRQPSTSPRQKGISWKVALPVDRVPTRLCTEDLRGKTGLWLLWAA